MTKFEEMIENLKKNNWHYRIIALALALIIWFYVTGPQDDNLESIYTVPLEYRNLAEEYVITDMPDSVRIVLEGSRLDVTNLSAYVDCTDLEEGEYRLEVTPVIPGNANLISLSPGYITVQVEKYADIDRTVEIHYGEGSPKDGYAAQDAIISPVEVKISGAQADIDQIGDVYVSVDLADLDESYNQRLQVNITDGDGNLITDRFKISPANVQVIVPILQGGTNKSLLIEVETTGTAASGYEILSIAANPAAITVYGNAADLNALTKIETEPIDISGLTKTVTRSVTLKLPSNIQYFGSANILATIVVEKMDEVAKETVYEDLEIEIENQNAEYTYTLEPNFADLTVANSGQEGESTLFIDAEGLEEGTHTVTVEARTQGDIININPKTITLTIRKSTE